MFGGAVRDSCPQTRGLICAVSCFQIVDCTLHTPVLQRTLFAQQGGCEVVLGLATADSAVGNPASAATFCNKCVFATTTRNPTLDFSHRVLGDSQSRRKAEAEAEAEEVWWGTVQSCLQSAVCSLVYILTLLIDS